MNDAGEEAPVLLAPENLGRLFYQRDAFMKALGVELIDIGPGTATVRMTVGKKHLNFNGTCHGGAIFSLADCAFGLSSNSHGVAAAGICANIMYQAAAREGDILTSTSRETSRSRKLATYDINVIAEETGLIASFTSTVYIIGTPHTDTVK